MSKKSKYVPFSQRSGLKPMPPQLNLGEVSEQMRTLFWYAVYKSILENTYFRGSTNFITGNWDNILLDIHVRRLGKMPETFSADLNKQSKFLKQQIMNSSYGELFDFIEYLLCHDKCPENLKMELAHSFSDEKAAYRIADNRIIAIGIEEQGNAVIQAISDSDKSNSLGAREHLINAGVELKNGKWASSIRESINAVESIAVKISPKAKTLGTALRNLESDGKLHGALKSAFSQLYGWTSDEEGIRHANVYTDKADVDEADALFMLGACASFVSYLIFKSTEFNDLE